MCFLLAVGDFFEKLQRCVRYTLSPIIGNDANLRLYETENQILIIKFIFKMCNLVRLISKSFLEAAAEERIFPFNLRCVKKSGESFLQICVV